LIPFTLSFHHATPHGVVSAVNIPDSPEPVPETVLATLPPAEREHALGLRGYRQVQFVGGRIALRQACEQLGARPPSLLPDDRGAPKIPPGLVGSVSHKTTLAVGMVARAAAGTLGVDLEDYGPPRPNIASRILTPPELEEIAGLPEDRRWISIVLRFSIKEAIYKALDPYVRRYVGFHEARVHPDLEGRAAVSLDLERGEGPFEVDARYEWLRGRILTSVRIRPSPQPDQPAEPARI
jgi:4'-phosphopantetheinyl transferase EntD